MSEIYTPESIDILYDIFVDASLNIVKGPPVRVVQNDNIGKIIRLRIYSGYVLISPVDVNININMIRKSDGLTHYVIQSNIYRGTDSSFLVLVTNDITKDPGEYDAFITLTIEGSPRSVIRVPKSFKIYVEPNPANVRYIAPGSNLFGGTLFRDSILEVTSNYIPESVIRCYITKSYASNSSSGDWLFFNRSNAYGYTDEPVPFYSDFKQNIQYTLILKGLIGDYNYGMSGSSKVFIGFLYTDGTVDHIVFDGIAYIPHGSTGFYRLVSDVDKSVEALCIYITTGATPSYTELDYLQCGLFEGDVAIEDFKPYVG